MAVRHRDDRHLRPLVASLLLVMLLLGTLFQAFASEPEFTEYT